MIKPRLNYDGIVQYKTPIYSKKGKEAYVYWYVLDPQSVLDGNPKLKRLKKKFNHIKSKRERDEAALRFRDEVARKLAQGWNPLVQERGKRGFAVIEESILKYRRFLAKKLKEDVIKKATIDNYLCRLNKLEKYIEQQPTPYIYMYQLDLPFFEGFLEYIYIDRDTSTRTRNNYLNWLSSFCAYMKSNGFMETNFAEQLTRLRVNEKQRKPIEEKDIKQLAEYLEKENRHFLLACLMMYYTLVRPNELTYIQLKDFNLKEQTLYLSHEFTKNRKDAMVTIPAKIIRLMVELETFNHPDTFYLFGKGFIPSEKKEEGRIFREYFVKVRQALNWPDYYQFYSLKDSGITDAIDAVGLTVAKDQARHSSVAVTNKYVRKEQMKAHPELKNFEGKL